MRRTIEELDELISDIEREIWNWQKTLDVKKRQRAAIASTNGFAKIDKGQENLHTFTHAKNVVPGKNMKET